MTAIDKQIDQFIAARNEARNRPNGIAQALVRSRYNPITRRNHTPATERPAPERPAPEPQEPQQ